MPTLKQATARANSRYNTNKPNAAAVAQFGQSKAEFDTGDILDQIETAVGDFIARVLDNIDRATGSTGEPLINSGDITNISAEKTDSGWQIKAPPHLDFQSKGVSGTERKIPGSPYSFSGRYQTVNLDSIKTWIRTRGIKFEGVSEDATAYLIGRSIYKNGIEPKRLWEDEVLQLSDEASTQIADYIAESFKGSQKIDKKIT